MEKKRKLYGTILGVIMFILLVLGFTYAYSSWISSKTNIGINSDCFIIDYTTGDNINSNDESIDITSNDLFLLNETDFLTNTSITITEGMALTSVSMGLNSACNINGVGTINLNVTELSEAFTSAGDSYGSLKYVLAEYSSASYPTVTVEALSNSIFNIVSTGTITSTGNIELQKVNLTHETTYEYLIIFYIDEVIAQNDVATATFKGTISAEAIQGRYIVPVRGNAAQGIINLYNPNGNTKPTVNNITYNLDTTTRLMADTAGNIRYYGADDPDIDDDLNNYIYFNCEEYPSTNCEPWRIIGVFDDKIKIMRNESIGGYSWDTSSATINDGLGINEWSQADLMKLLNPGYENNTGEICTFDWDTFETICDETLGLVNNSLYWTGAQGVEGMCYEYLENNTITCDFTSTGLKNDTTRNLVSEHIGV